MTVQINSQAVVDPKAELGQNCEIGPFCTVGPYVRIGDDTVLRSHVVVDGHTTIGDECEIYPFVTLGVQSQDQKYQKGSITYCEIGDRNQIREYVSIHSATEEGSKTVLGDDCAILAHAHIAHNCLVGDNVTMSHAATLAGHVTVGDWANFGGLCAVHQFCQVGTAAMVAGMARVVQDVLPFTIAEGYPAHMRIVNKVGMERAGYDSTAVHDIRRAFRILFMRTLLLEEAKKQIREEIGDKPHVALLLEAIDNSARGLARPDEADAANV